MNTEPDHQDLQGTTEPTVPDAAAAEPRRMVSPIALATANAIDEFDAQRAELKKLADALAADRASIEREKIALLHLNQALRQAEVVRDAGYADARAASSRNSTTDAVRSRHILQAFARADSPR